MIHEADRLPIRSCPRCGVAMVSRRDDARSIGEDTYECVFCGTVVNFPFDKPRHAKDAAKPAARPGP